MDWFFFIFFYHHETIWGIILAWNFPKESFAEIILPTLLGPINLSLALAFWGGFVMTTPFILYQGYDFIETALYTKEKKILKKILGLIVMAVLAGQIFCAFVVTPFIIKGLLAFRFSWLSPLLDMQSCLSFILTLHQAFFILSLWPCFLIGLIALQWIKVSSLMTYRKLYWVGAFVLGMIMTPPDVFAQCIVAIVLIAIYEGVLFWAQR